MNRWKARDKRQGLEKGTTTEVKKVREDRAGRVTSSGPEHLEGRRRRVRKGLDTSGYTIDK